jgi:tetratricopeptide (TPR) repeat protein
MSEPLVPGSLEREIRDLRAVLFSDRDPDGRGFAPLADALRRSGDLGRALEVVEAGVRRLPDFATGHVVAGWIHRALADAEEAERSFRKVLELDDENISALKGLGFLLADQGESQEARDVFLKLDDLDPGDPEVRARLVELGDSDGFVEIDDLAPASEEMDVVVDIEALAPGGAGVPDAQGPVVDIATLAPDDFVDIEDLAPEVEVEVEAGPADHEEEGPEEEVDQAEARDEDDDPATRTMAELFVRQGHLDRAIRIYRRLAEDRPDDASLRTRLAEIEGSAGAGPTAASGEAVEPSVTDYLAALLAWRPGSAGTNEDGES